MGFCMLVLAPRAVVYCATHTGSLGCPSQQWPLITWMAFAEQADKEDHPKGPTRSSVEKLRIQWFCCENLPYHWLRPGPWVIVGVYTVAVLRIPLCCWSLHPLSALKRWIFLVVSVVHVLFTCTNVILRLKHAVTLQVAKNSTLASQLFQAGNIKVRKKYHYYWSRVFIEYFIFKPLVKFDHFSANKQFFKRRMWTFCHHLPTFLQSHVTNVL